MLDTAPEGHNCFALSNKTTTQQHPREQKEKPSSWPPGAPQSSLTGVETQCSLPRLASAWLLSRLIQSSGLKDALPSRLPSHAYQSQFQPRASVATFFSSPQRASGASEAVRACWPDHVHKGATGQIPGPRT
ncbi:hypothetical protein M3J09_007787 [Ascochyta lentis]